jgi:Peptidase MA superfamily
MWVFFARRACAGSHTGMEPCRRFPLISALLLASLLFGTSSFGGLAHGESAEKPLCVCADCQCPLARTSQQCAAESDRFVVQSFLGGPNALEVARHSESVCSQLCRDIFGLAATDRWQPKCKVVLHADRIEYANAVGRGASQTVGSSAISLSGGRVTQRRIDLLVVNVDQGLSALPHELVHVLFADAFPTTAPPKWAEEGLALLMDPAEKRARHSRDLDAALRAHSTIPLGRLLADVEYPASTQRAVFYGQSMSLVDYFVQLDSPKEFVRYLKISAERGQEYALQAVYDMDRQELERRWSQYAEGMKLADAVTR